MIKSVVQKLKNNEPVIGAMVSFGDAAISDLFVHAGFDLIRIDHGHTGFDRQEIFHHVTATRRSGTAAFVRVLWNDPVPVKSIADMGVDGIIFPFIRARGEAESVVSSGCILLRERGDTARSGPQRKPFR